MTVLRYILVGSALIGAAGCKSKERDYSASQDRVHVDVPFVNVRVGQDGGARVDAPFTHVETPRYQQQQMQQPQVQYQQGPAPVYQTGTPVNSTGYPQQVPTGTYAPVQSSSQYTPATAIRPAQGYSP